METGHALWPGAPAPATAAAVADTRMLVLQPRLALHRQQLQQQQQPRRPAGQQKQLLLLHAWRCEHLRPLQQQQGQWSQQHMSPTPIVAGWRTAVVVVASGAAVASKPLIPSGISSRIGSSSNSSSSSRAGSRSSSSGSSNSSSSSSSNSSSSSSSNSNSITGRNVCCFGSRRGPHSPQPPRPLARRRLRSPAFPASAAGGGAADDLETASGVADYTDTGGEEDEGTLIGREVQRCRELVDRMGTGFVYLGSSRIAEDHPFFVQARDLSRQIALAYGGTTWSGIGPGLMEAVCQGAKLAERPAAGFKVVMEATQGPSASYKHPHLPSHSYIVCRSILARKQGLLWAGSRVCPSHATGFVALPGGVGTLDELLDLLALRQLAMLPRCARHPAPLLVLNYGGVYDGLLQCLDGMRQWAVVADGELDPLWHVCRDNEEAMGVLDKFYGGVVHRTVSSKGE